MGGEVGVRPPPCQNSTDSLNSDFYVRKNKKNKKNKNKLGGGGGGPTPQKASIFFTQVYLFCA
jgi:hypothetical protein